MLVISGGGLAVRHLSLFPNPEGADCDGSNVGKSITSNLAAPYEQFVKDVIVAEHI